jgi:hypothetical protein
LGAEVERLGERLHVTLHGDLGIMAENDGPWKYHHYAYKRSQSPQWKGTAADLALAKNLPNLKLLTVDGLRLTDASWKAIGEFRQLQHLDLDATPVTGVELQHLTKLSDLAALHLRFLLHLQDDHLSVLRNFNNLIGLTILDSPVGDKGIAALQSLRKVTDVDLSGTKVTGKGLRYLGELSELKRLTLKKCPVADDGLAHLSKLAKLRSLVLDGTRITDNGLAYVTHLPIDWLSLDRTQVTNAGLARLVGLKSLLDLSLQGTKVDDEVVPILSKMTSLADLTLPTSVSDDAAARLHQALPKCRLTCEYYVRVGDSWARGNCPCSKRAETIKRIESRLRSR